MYVSPAIVPPTGVNVIAPPLCVALSSRVGLPWAMNTVGCAGLNGTVAAEADVAPNSAIRPTTRPSTRSTARMLPTRSILDPAQSIKGVS